MDTKLNNYDDIRILAAEVSGEDVKMMLLFTFLIDRIVFLENKKPTYVPPPVFGPCR